jgi:adenylate kinase
VTRIGVFGVSGVGKTASCRAYVARHPDFIHLTASELISKATGANLPRLRYANHTDIIGYQVVLQRALENAVLEGRISSLLLDGQCVIDNGRELLVLPVEYIAPLRLTGIALLEERPDVIFGRRQRDLRERPVRTIEEISEQLRMNRIAVERYSSVLALPFVVAEAKDEFCLDDPVDRLM